MISKISKASEKRITDCTHALVSTFNPDWQSCARGCGYVGKTPPKPIENNLGRTTPLREAWANLPKRQKTDASR